MNEISIYLEAVGFSWPRDDPRQMSLALSHDNCFEEILSFLQEENIDHEFVFSQDKEGKQRITNLKTTLKVLKVVDNGIIYVLLKANLDKEAQQPEKKPIQKIQITSKPIQQDPPQIQVPIRPPEQDKSQNEFIVNIQVNGETIQQGLGYRGKHGSKIQNIIDQLLMEGIIRNSPYIATLKDDEGKEISSDPKYVLQEPQIKNKGRYVLSIKQNETPKDQQPIRDSQGNLLSKEKQEAYYRELESQRISQQEFERQDRIRNQKLKEDLATFGQDGNKIHNSAKEAFLQEKQRQQKQEEERQLELQKQQEAQRIEQLRQQEEQKRQEQIRIQEEARRQELIRQQEALRLEQQRIQDEAKRQEDARQQELLHQARQEQLRLQEDARKQEEARKIEWYKRQEAERLEAERKEAERQEAERQEAQRLQYLRQQELQQQQNEWQERQQQKLHQKFEMPPQQTYNKSLIADQSDWSGFVPLNQQQRPPQIPSQEPSFKKSNSETSYQESKSFDRLSSSIISQQDELIKLKLQAINFKFKGNKQETMCKTKITKSIGEFIKSLHTNQIIPQPSAKLHLSKCGLNILNPERTFQSYNIDQSWILFITLVEEEEEELDII